MVGQVTESLKVKQKLKPMNKAMLATHTLNNIISIFVSTFLISYIYSISTNYVMNVAVFYAFNYLAMMVFYFVISNVIDRTNRVWFYRAAIVIRSVFIICIVYWGADLAKYVVLAGFLHGFSEACYWTSYNLMKNELVSKHAVAKYSGLQIIICEITNIVVPIVLGSIINAAHFETCAKIVLVIAVIELVLSVFIKSKRPENSGFDLKGFFSHIKDKGYEGKLIVLSIIIGGFYGFTTVLTSLKTIIIMYEFGSDFSLGIITSVIAVVTLVVIMLLKKFTKIGNRKAFFLISAFLPIPATLLLTISVSKATIIIYSLVSAVCMVMHTMSYDVIRNILLKKLHLYDDIAEYQCSIECVMALCRIVMFSLMAFAGAIGAYFGSVFIALKVFMCFSILSITLMDLFLIVMENKLVKKGITED